MGAIEQVQAELAARPRSWLVTGAAGFIGSHLVERLLLLGQTVIGLDNFATGTRENLGDVMVKVGPKAAGKLRVVEGDIRDLSVCRNACAGADLVLHEAGLGSVPRSIEDPLTTHQVNVDGFLNLIIAARDAGASRFVYATSSSVYGDAPARSKTEGRIGRALSPYAVTKRIDELYAQIFSRAYGVETIGLRYFNVFGPRQDPKGPYAAVIPRWIAALSQGDPCVIFGDGKTSRDFCHVENVIQANLLAAAAAPRSAAVDQIYNVGVGKPTTLSRLFVLIRDLLAERGLPVRDAKPIHQAFRPGDVRHSKPDTSKAEELLGYRPSRSLASGLEETIEWFVRRIGNAPRRHRAGNSARNKSLRAEPSMSEVKSTYRPSEENLAKV
jgi:UDP-N-acetylglucosamine 4-epimerase